MSKRHFTNKYDDIINLPHPVSRKRQPMPLYDRAAQFAPFAALTGHGEAIHETARLTGQRIELDEYEKEALRGRLQYLCNCVDAWNASGRPVEERPQVEVTYFEPDHLKEGGKYVTVCGTVKKIDQYLRQLVLAARDDTDEQSEGQAAWMEVPIDEIILVESEILEDCNE